MTLILYIILDDSVINNARKCSLKPRDLEKGSGSPIVSHMHGHKTTQKTKTALQNPLDQTTDWPASKEREAAFMLGESKRSRESGADD
jgi:hypothetical protein